MTESTIFRAVGLAGDDLQSTAPELVCKGEYHLADTIVSLARRYGVPVVERAELASALNDLPLDTEIPSHLFEAAAELLAEIGVIGKK
jgi:type III secretion system FlhB-like substrate exporter